MLATATSPAVAAPAAPAPSPSPTPSIAAAPPTATARQPRDVVAVAGALRQLDDAVALAERAAAIPVPGTGLFGGSRDAHDAAVAKRAELLAPAHQAITGAVAVLDANGGYRQQPRDGSYGDPKPPGYRVPFHGLGDNAHDMVAISRVAAENPVKFKWVNDFPWQDNPTTTLERMVEIVKEQAGTVTRGEARLSLHKVTDMTSELLYDRRATELGVPELQRLQDAVVAVRSIADSRFADDALRAELATLPSQVLVDGRLTTDPASLEALEQLHRATVVDAGAAKVDVNVAVQLARAQQLAAAGDTAGAREIYESLAGAGTGAA